MCPVLKSYRVVHPVISFLTLLLSLWQYYYATICSSRYLLFWLLLPPTHRVRAVGTGRDYPPPPDYEISVNPISTKGGGVDYAHHITTCPPRIFRPCYGPAESQRFSFLFYSTWYILCWYLCTFPCRVWFAILRQGCWNKPDRSDCSLKTGSDKIVYWLCRFFFLMGFYYIQGVPHLRENH